MRYQQNIKNTPTPTHITKNNQPNKNKNNYANAKFGQGCRATEIFVSAGGMQSGTAILGKCQYLRKLSL